MHSNVAMYVATEICPLPSTCHTLPHQDVCRQTAPGPRFIEQSGEESTEGGGGVESRR